jgi:hypothetical protein
MTPADHLQPARQDILALRVVSRFAYAAAQPASRNAVGGYPFAVLNEAL